MAYTAAADGPLPTVTAVPGITALQRALLWLVGAGGAIVFIEPSPYELATFAAMIVFFATGLRMRAPFVPLLALLFLVNFGYAICAADLMSESKIVNWILTSCYMAVTVIFFAMVLSEDTAARLDLLRRGLVAGALIASAAGIVGYFSILPGSHDLFTLYNRASGTFKDPNVLAGFLILPALFALQRVVTQPLGPALRSALAFGVIALALLLAFSRAAWGQLVLTSVFMLVLMFVTSGSTKQRSRIVVTALAAVTAMAVLTVLLLSFDSIGGLFKERASFDQSYDEGRFGRFGRYVLGAQMALDMPLGIGPLQFTRYFPEDTHNSYLNAFMSGGWIAGICFPALVFTTVFLGFRYVLIRTPWQRGYIAVFAAFLGTVGESFIIDVDHWRHFWLTLGAMWGMAAASQRFKAASAR